MQADFHPVHSQDWGGWILADIDALLQAGESADIGDIIVLESRAWIIKICFEVDMHTLIPVTFYFGQQFTNPLAHVAVEQEGLLDVIDGQMCPEGDALGSYDVTQLASLGTLDLHVPFGYHSLQVPVHRAHRHTQLSCQGSLGNIWVNLDLLEKDHLTGGLWIFCHWLK